jgi:hypothetical protein
VAERVSVNSPLKDQAFSTFLGQNPPLELPPVELIFAPLESDPPAREKLVGRA